MHICLYVCIFVSMFYGRSVGNGCLFSILLLVKMMCIRD
jgi:hypothetical protein